ncbi:MAG: phosphate acyltransferase PlsX [Clostridiales bacterium]|jgi:glycerol-3-phosphate acyltransferase PlsX|nr:phosphate acyltransferase PlsX [Clostridiales bacterium]
MKIVVDAFGGDNAPSEIVKGAVTALKAASGFGIVLTGKKDAIKSELDALGMSADGGRLEIIDANEVITNDDAPTAAIRGKTDSSLVVGLDYLKNNADAAAFVSAGSTGAVLTGATLKIGRIENVSRPALAPLLPCADGSHILLADCGANVDCKPEMLLQFGVMGAAYMRASGIRNPRVALLNNGAEAKKGNELTKAAYVLLEGSGLNFVGNMEAREIMSGAADVLVTDGFGGNIALKALEGAALTIFKLMKEAIMSGGILPKIGGFLVKNAMKDMRSKLDYTENGGALFLGVSKVVIKAHGSSKANAVKAAILQAYGLARAGLTDKIREAMADGSRNG